MKWTENQIQEYKDSCLRNFKGLGGNMPIEQFIEKYPFTSYIIPNCDERFVLSEEPLSFCYHFVEPNVDYEVVSPYQGDKYAKLPNKWERYIFPTDTIAPILGINIVSQLTGKEFMVPLVSMIEKVKTIDAGIVRPNGDVNRYLFEAIEESKPYITIRELFEELIEFLGNRPFYFTDEIHQNWKHGPIEVVIYNCHLAKIRTRKS